MKAAIYRRPGCLEVSEKPIPSPKPGELLLQVRRVGLCGTDMLIFQGGMSERAVPGRILGHEMVAVIAETKNSEAYQTGARVVVEPTVACGHCLACQRGFNHVCENLRFLGIDADGALQEFWSVPADRLHSIPASVSDDHATMIEPLAVAVHDVRLAAIQPEETVAVIGGGPIGLMIALLARRTGARAIILETNAHRLAFARNLGFQVCDVSLQDPAEVVQDFTRGAGADVVFEVSGSATGARLMTALAAVRGRLIAVGIQSRETSLDLFQIFYRELSLQGVRAYTREDFAEAIRLIASGDIQLGAFISGRFPLGDVQAAFELVLSGAPVIKTLIDFTIANETRSPDRA
jgi:(R,R)-butanediol dehydrogenase/meso-butanediol dehydrogenase/diacetyl reductase